MPIVNAVLQHRSQQMEAGIARLTEFEVPQLLRAKFQAGSIRRHWEAVSVHRFSQQEKPQ
jgi:primosomal replication protein N